MAHSLQLPSGVIRAQKLDELINAHFVDVSVPRLESLLHGVDFFAEACRRYRDGLVMLTTARQVILHTDALVHLECRAGIFGDRRAVTGDGQNKLERDFGADVCGDLWVK